MAYTRQWDSAYENTPSGADQRSTVDDRIRDLKKDVRERMDTICNWLIQDPISVKPEFSGIMNGKVLMMHAGGFNGSGDDALISSNGSIYSGVGSSGLLLIAPLWLPATAEVTNIQGMFKNLASSNLSPTLKLNRIQWDVDSPTTFVTATRAFTPNEVGTVSQSPGSPLVISDSYLHYLQVDCALGSGSVSCAFYGAKITYNIPTAVALR